MSLAPPASVEKLQAALHAKAKGASTYRFYALYDKVYRRDVLAYAYERCRAKEGAPGVDGQTFADIEKYGRQQWLDACSSARRARLQKVSSPSNSGTDFGSPALLVQMLYNVVIHPSFLLRLQDFLGASSGSLPGR